MAGEISERQHFHIYDMHGRVARRMETQSLGSGARPTTTTEPMAVSNRILVRVLKPLRMFLHNAIAVAVRLQRKIRLLPAKHNGQVGGERRRRRRRRTRQWQGNGQQTHCALSLNGFVGFCRSILCAPHRRWDGGSSSSSSKNMRMSLRRTDCWENCRKKKHITGMKCDRWWPCVWISKVSCQMIEVYR